MKNLCLSLSFLVICLQLGFAQNKWLSFKSHVGITDFVELEEELQLATSNGLVKLNKFNFEKTYWTTENTNLPSSHVQAITIDDQGNSWIGTYDGILARVTNTGFTDITPIPDSLWDESYKLLCLEVDHNDVKWIGMTNGLLRYDGIHWTLYNHNTIANPSVFLSDTWDIDIDQDNKLTISSFDIYQFDGINWTNLSQAAQLFTYEGADLARDHNNHLWWTNLAGSIAKFDNGYWTTYHSSNAAQWEPAPPTGQIKGIARHPNGTMMSYTEDQLYFLLDEKWVLQTIPQMEENSNPLDFFYFDQDQNTWLAAGIYLSKKTPDTFTEINIGAYPLHSNITHDFVEANDGSLYIVNNKSHISVYKEDQWSELNTDFLRSIHAHIAINDIAIGLDNQVYLSTNQGLFEYNAGAWTHYHAENNNAPFYSVNQLAVDQQGRLWITAWNAAVMYQENGLWYTYNASNAPILEEENFHDIVVDQNNVVWTYSHANKLYRIENSLWESIDLIPINNQIGFAGDIHVDQQNRLWFTSSTNGLYQFDGTDWKHFNSSNTDLPTDQILSITSTPLGLLYFGTKLGLTTYDGDAWKSYDSNNSILYDKPINKIFATSDGACWMGINYYGLVSFKLDGSTTSTSNPDQEIHAQLTIAPNPADSFVDLMYTLTKDAPVNISIVDAQARVHFQQNWSQQASGTQRLRLNLQNLHKGIYFIRIQTQDQFSVRKLILQ